MTELLAGAAARVAVLSIIAVLLLAWLPKGNAQDVYQHAGARRAILAEQASRTPAGPAHALPINMGPPHQFKAIEKPPPAELPVVGLVLETRAPVNVNQTPAFPEQTRARRVQSRTELAVTVVARGLSKPWGLAFLPDGRLLITEKESGILRVVGKRGQLGKPIAGLPPIFHFHGDGGLLDLVIDPAFAQSRRLYFSFVGFLEGGNALMVASAVLSRDETRLEQLTQLLTMPAFINAAHYGGRLMLGPDGKLYLGASERMSDTVRLASQDPKSPLGKVLRFNTDGSVPLDNPFAGVPGADPTVYALGCRDTQGFAIQPGTKAVWATEHGPQGGDEINILLAGHNYGWPLASYGLEYSDQPVNGGKSAWPGTDQPVYYWDPAIAPSGATFYSGALFPEWKSDLFVAALAGKHVAHLVIRGDKVVGEERLLVEQGQRIRDVRQGPDGALWVWTDDEQDGRILRITPRKESARHMP